MALDMTQSPETLPERDLLRVPRDLIAPLTMIADALVATAIYSDDERHRLYAEYRRLKQSCAEARLRRDALFEREASRDARGEASDDFVKLDEQRRAFLNQHPMIVRLARTI